MARKHRLKLGDQNLGANGGMKVFRLLNSLTLVMEPNHISSIDLRIIEAGRRKAKRFANARASAKTSMKQANA